MCPAGAAPVSGGWLSQCRSLSLTLGAAWEPASVCPAGSAPETFPARCRLPCDLRGDLRGDLHGDRHTQGARRPVLGTPPAPSLFVTGWGAGGGGGGRGQHSQRREGRGRLPSQGARLTGEGLTGKSQAVPPEQGPQRPPRSDQSAAFLPASSSSTRGAGPAPSWGGGGAAGPWGSFGAPAPAGRHPLF